MRNTCKALFAALIISLFIMQPVSSYADWQGHNGGGYNHSSGYAHSGGYSHGSHWGGYNHSYVGVNFSVWPDNYYYDAPYYLPEDGVLVSGPIEEPVVQQPVEVIQPPVVVDSQSQGAAPAITMPAAANDMPDSMTINIPNNKGGYTAVTLKKSGNGFIGPQGEFYSEFPKVSQLEIIYGK